MPQFNTQGLALVLRVGNLGRQTNALKLALANLPGRAQRTIGRQAVSKAARPVSQRLKLLAKVQSSQSARNEGTGQLARSIGTKIATSRRRKGAVYSLVGARKSSRFTATFALPAGRRKRAVNTTRLLQKGRADRLPKAGRLVKRNPKKYFHLIERGFTHRSGKKVRGWALLFKTWRETSRLSRRIMRLTIAQGIGREAAKIRVRTAFRGGRAA